MWLAGLLLGLLIAPTLALGGSTLGQLTVLPEEGSPELTLKLSSKLQCPQDIGNRFPGVTGEVRYQGRRIRFEIFRYTGSTELALGPAPARPLELSIALDQDGGCLAPDLTAQVEEAAPQNRDYAALALKHSPFVVIRKDQKKNRFTDVPVGLTYSVFRRSDGAFSIRYTLYMTDEDSKGYFATGREQSMGQYGRRTDIEWLYQVDFDPSGRVRKRTYQGGVVFGIGHKTWTFRGHYLPGSEHPILYDISKHNVFRDKPIWGQKKLGVLGHHLMAREELKAPLDRDWWQLEHPWVFRVSDLELAREHRLKAASDDYLYVSVMGSLSHGRLGVRLRMFDDWGDDIWSGGGAGFLSALGESLWGREGFTALPVGRDRLEQIADFGGRDQLGVLDLNDPFGDGTRLKLDALRFFRLVDDGDGGSFRLEELTDRFRCALDNLFTECEF